MRFPLLLSLSAVLALSPLTLPLTRSQIHKAQAAEAHYSVAYRQAVGQLMGAALVDREGWQKLEYLTTQIGPDYRGQDNLKRPSVGCTNGCRPKSWTMCACSLSRCPTGSEGLNQRPCFCPMPKACPCWDSEGVWAPLRKGFGLRSWWSALLTNSMPWGKKASKAKLCCITCLAGL